MAILGFAYKKGTSDARESAAIDVVWRLADEGAQVVIYDPAVEEEQIWTELENGGAPMNVLKDRVSVASFPYHACQGAHAVVILTEWEQFSNKDNHTSPLNVASTAPLGPNTRFGGTVTQTDPQTSTATKTSCFELNKPYWGNDEEQPCLGPRLGRSRSFPRHHDHREHLDWRRIALNMKEPRIVFDSRNIINEETLEKLGVKVEAIGRASNESR